MSPVTPVAAAPRHWHWESADRAVSIQLAYAAIDALNEALRTLAADAPVRGAELGGILLGSAHRDGALTVSIEGFEPFPSSYPRGASWLLDPQALETFEEALRRPRDLEVIGFFRSHTRKDLFLSEDDVTFIQQFFPGPDNVVLLVKPFTTRPSVGGLFLWQNGVLLRQTAAVEFPFQREDPPAVRTPAPVKPALPKPVESYETIVPRGVPLPRNIPPAEFAQRSSLGLRDAPAQTGSYEDDEPLFVPAHPRQPLSAMAKIWIGLGILALAAVGLFGYVQYSSAHAPKAVLKTVAGTLRLAASEGDRNITVTWDRQSPIIEAATHGSLLIEEGSFHKLVDIDPVQLRLGRLIYSRPDAISDTVAFRLQVETSQGEPLTEMLQFVARAPIAPAALAAPPARTFRTPEPVLRKPAEAVHKPIVPPPAPELGLSAVPAQPPITNLLPPPPKETPTIARPAPRKEP